MGYIVRTVLCRSQSNATRPSLTRFYSSRSAIPLSETEKEKLCLADGRWCIGIGSRYERQNHIRRKP